MNLFTGVMSCGLICLLVIWMDRRWLPPALQPPLWLKALNAASALVFGALGIKGYVDNENRIVVVCSMLGLFVLAVLAALILKPAGNAPNASDSAVAIIWHRKPTKLTGRTLRIQRVTRSSRSDTGERPF